MGSNQSTTRDHSGAIRAQTHSGHTPNAPHPTSATLGARDDRGATRVAFQQVSARARRLGGLLLWLMAMAAKAAASVLAMAVASALAMAIATAVAYSPP